MAKTAGIVGAGLIGRILALRLIREGWNVTIFDKDDTGGRKSCGFIAGGMLSLYSEAEIIGDLVVQLGQKSIILWPEILSFLGVESYLRVLGSVIVAHASDLSDLERVCFMVRRRFPEIFSDLCITDNICELVPGLSVSHGVHIKGEGDIDSMRLFRSLETALKSLGAIWRSHTAVREVSPGKIVGDEGSCHFDFVFDCRGIGARCDIEGLRGVRGEVILVRAPGVTIEFPTRMMHPRYSIYVVPRPDNTFLIGSTEIESCDFSEISVQSVLEMLSAAYSLHRGFAEARVLDMMTGCRPAFSDNLPRLFVGEGIMRINGLYRYGYLAAPAMVEEVMLYLKGSCGDYPALYRSLKSEQEACF
ncbi:FAD-dependent oxidoreductase [Anaplasma bovis]|uniref:FAD-dependent oxidoreductase n=1 Tax=Anaplasma bovis TaxID=186733 RepID=UPI002FF08F22